MTLSEFMTPELIKEMPPRIVAYEIVTDLEITDCVTAFQQMSFQVGSVNASARVKELWEQRTLWRQKIPPIGPERGSHIEEYETILTWKQDAPRL